MSPSFVSREALFAEACQGASYVHVSRFTFYLSRFPFHLSSFTGHA